MWLFYFQIIWTGRIFPLNILLLIGTTPPPFFFNQCFGNSNKSTKKSLGWCSAMSIATFELASRSMPLNEVIRAKHLSYFSFVKIALLILLFTLLIEREKKERVGYACDVFDKKFRWKRILIQKPKTVQSIVHRITIALLFLLFTPLMEREKEGPSLKIKDLID